MALEKSLSNHNEPRFVARFVPLLGWASGYERWWLRPDLMAGLTVAALVVPKALGYADIAGVPIQYDLYAAVAAFGVYSVPQNRLGVNTGGHRSV